METRLNFVLIGIFFVASLCALVGFVLWLGKFDRNTQEYHVYYLYAKELPKGVHVETPVRYLGINVGFVHSFNFSHRDNKEVVEIELWVNKDIVLKQGAYALVESPSLTGSNVFVIVQGEGENLALSGHVVLELKQNWLEKAGSQLEKVSTQLEHGLDQFNKLLSDENLNNLSNTFAALSSASAKMDSIFHNFNSITHNVNEVVEDIDLVTIFIKEQLQKFGEIQDSIKASVDSGDYNLRTILTPMLYQLQADMERTNTILDQTQNTLQILQNSPKDFWFGVRTQKLGPGE